MTKEIFVGPDHSAILALDCFQLVQNVFDRTLAIFASLKERHETEIAVVRTASSRNGCGVAIAVFLAQELPIREDAFQIAKIVESPVIKRFHFTTLKIGDNLRPDR